MQRGARAHCGQISAADNAAGVRIYNIDHIRMHQVRMFFVAVVITLDVL